MTSLHWHHWSHNFMLSLVFKQALMHLICTKSGGSYVCLCGKNSAPNVLSFNKREFAFTIQGWQRSFLRWFNVSILSSLLGYPAYSWQSTWGTPQGRVAGKHPAPSSVKGLLAQKHFAVSEVKTSQSTSTVPFKFLRLHVARTTFQQNEVDTEGADKYSCTPGMFINL